MRAHLRVQAGQASVEWVALLCVMSIALGGIAAAVAGANPAGVTNAVVGGMRRALCVVTGDRCVDPVVRACTVSTGRVGGRLGVDLAVVSIGAGRYVLTELRSDGTAAVSLIDEADLSTAFGAGASARLSLGRARRVRISAGASLELAAHLAHRRTWEVPDARAASALAGRLGHLAAEEAVRSTPVVGGIIGAAGDLTGLSTHVRPPDRVGLEGGASATAGLELTGGSEASAGLSTTLGGTIDRRTGARTLAFRLEGEAAASLRLLLLHGPEREGEGEVGLTVDYDRHGTPTSLSLTGSGAGLRIPGVPDPPAGAAGEGRVTATATLDLTSTAHRAVYDRLVHALDPRHVGELPGATRALAEVMGADAREEVARYRDDDVSYGGDLSAMLGGRIGLGGEVGSTSSELVDAWARPPEGAWEQRQDCLAAGSRT